MVERRIVWGALSLGVASFWSCGGGGGASASLQATFVAPAGEVSEGATAELVVQLVGDGPALEQDVTVRVVATGGGDAAPDLDLALEAATAVFPAGAQAGATQTVAVPARADGLIEAALETAELALSGGGPGLAIDGGARHLLSIAETEHATLRFAAAQSTTPGEADAAFTVQVELLLPPDTALGVDVSATVRDTLTGSATSGGDYLGFDPVEVQFPAGAESGSLRPVQVMVSDDAELEGLETVMLELTAPSAAAVLDAQATHELAILDDELSPTPTLAVIAETPNDSAAVGDGALLDLGAGQVGGGPNEGLVLELQNLSTQPLALSVLTLTGDTRDFAIELEDPAAAAMLLPTPAPFPFAVEAEELAQDSAQGIALRLDEAALAALAPLERVLLEAVPAPGSAPLALELERLANPWSADARVRVGDRERALGALLAGQSLWAGRVAGDPQSAAFLSLSPHGSHGFVRLADGATLVLTSERDARADGRRPLTRAVWAAALEAQTRRPVALECAGALDPAGGQHAPGAPPTPEELGGGLGLGACRLAIETDFQLHERFGSVEATAAYVTGLVAAVSAQYRVDVQAELEIAYLGIYPTADDPWTTPDTGGGTSAMLDEFRSAWLADGWPQEADLAHFVSGANLGGGVAYVGVLCSDSFGFGVSANINGNIDWSGFDGSPSSINWDFIVFAHELGHNFGSSHTHSYCPPLDTCYTNCDDASGCPQSTIMSYCHLCGGLSNIRLEFHPYTANVMRGGVAGSCFGGAELAPAASARLRLRFEPTSGVGQKQATLRFTHDAENLPTPFQLQLEATATN